MSADPYGDNLLASIAKKKAARRAKEKRALPIELHQEIGNMIDHWEQLPNDLIGQLEGECPELVRSLNKIASSPQFAATK